jgi:hypothetical protein
MKKVSAHFQRDQCHYMDDMITVYEEEESFQTRMWSVIVFDDFKSWDCWWFLLRSQSLGPEDMSFILTRVFLILFKFIRKRFFDFSSKLGGLSVNNVERNRIPILWVEKFSVKVQKISFVKYLTSKIWIRYH